MEECRAKSTKSLCFQHCRLPFFFKDELYHYSQIGGIVSVHTQQPAYQPDRTTTKLTVLIKNELRLLKSALIKSNFTLFLFYSSNGKWKENEKGIWQVKFFFLWIIPSPPFQTYAQESCLSHLPNFFLCVSWGGEGEGEGRGGEGRGGGTTLPLLVYSSAGRYPRSEVSFSQRDRQTEKNGTN